jgi:hypothetical protein
MSSNKKIPARKWKQIRLHPEEERAVREFAEQSGLSYPSAIRQIIRAGLGKGNIYRKP